MPATKVKSRQSVPQRTNKAYKAIVDVAPKRPFPLNLGPMLATLVNEPFSSSEWSYEVKWDGYRALAFIKNGQVELKSRNAKSFNEKFYSVFAALQQSGLNAVIDGEIV